MTREEFERRKQRLEEQLHTGIELLQAGHRVQIRALEMVWMLAAQEAETAAAAVPVSRQPARQPEPPPVPRRGLPQVEDDLRAVMEGLPPVFDRSDVIQALGYEPDRRTLYKLLQELTREGTLAVEEPGFGRKPSRYRKV
ncbi:MAG TPA: hypothetical protein VEL74_12725 [Thermoanaerobaculia bacterium]|nr:hypothetical protein [Thermoanaerobaculia bacterium]